MKTTHDLNNAEHCQDPHLAASEELVEGRESRTFIQQKKTHGDTNAPLGLGGKTDVPLRVEDTVLPTMQQNSIMTQWQVLECQSSLRTNSSCDPVVLGENPGRREEQSTKFKRIKYKEKSLLAERCPFTNSPRRSYQPDS